VLVRDAAVRARDAAVRTGTHEEAPDVAAAGAVDAGPTQIPCRRWALHRDGLHSYCHST